MSMTKKSIPHHVAIIMDGNGRWAKQHNVPTIEGHRAGAKAAERIILAAQKAGVAYLTLYTFSTENFKRSSSWVTDLMGEFIYHLEHRLNFFTDQKIRISFIGDRSLLSKRMVFLMEQAEERTQKFEGLHVIFALSYGARNELTHATRRIAQDVKRGIIDVEHIDEHLVGQYLMTASFPDPDLFIRTSGEMRISNFLLWQVAYTEMVFTSVLWPDITAEHFHDLISGFPERERCFGSDRYAA